MRQEIFYIIFLKKYPNAKLTGMDVLPELIQVAKREVKNCDFIKGDVRKKSQLPKKNNAIMLKKNKGRNYNHVDKFSTIMFIDSTLGYEAISRGKKIISISARKVKSKIYHPFGYPSFSKNSNFFFTNYNKQKNIYRIIKNVYEISSKEWKK